MPQKTLTCERCRKELTLNAPTPRKARELASFIGWQLLKMPRPSGYGHGFYDFCPTCAPIHAQEQEALKP